MGKNWQDWRDAMKRRMAAGPSSSASAQPAVAPMSSNVVTLSRPKAPAQPVQPAQPAQVAVTVSEISEGVAVQPAPPGAYVDTLARKKPSSTPSPSIEAASHAATSEAPLVDPSALPSIEYAPGEEMDDHYKNLTINRKKHPHHSASGTQDAPPLIPAADVTAITTEVANTSISQ